MQNIDMTTLGGYMIITGIIVIYSVILLTDKSAVCRWFFIKKRRKQ